MLEKIASAFIFTFLNIMRELFLDIRKECKQKYIDLKKYSSERLDRIGQLLNNDTEYIMLKKYMLEDFLPEKIKWEKIDKEANDIIEMIEKGIAPEKTYSTLIEEANGLIKDCERDKEKFEKLTRYNYILKFEEEYILHAKKVKNKNPILAKLVSWWREDNRRLLSYYMEDLENLAAILYKTREEYAKSQAKPKEKGQAIDSFDSSKVKQDELLQKFSENRIIERMVELLDRCNELSTDNYNLAKEYLRKNNIITQEDNEPYEFKYELVNDRITQIENEKSMPFELRLFNIEHDYLSALVGKSKIVNEDGSPYIQTEADEHNEREMCWSDGNTIEGKGQRPYVGPVASSGYGILWFAPISSSVDNYLDKNGKPKKGIPVEIIYNGDGKPTASIRLDKMIPVSDSSQIVSLKMEGNNRQDVYNACKNKKVQARLFRKADYVLKNSAEFFQRKTDCVSENSSKFSHPLFFSQLVKHSINYLKNKTRIYEKGVMTWFRMCVDKFDEHKKSVLRRNVKRQKTNSGTKMGRTENLKQGNCSNSNQPYTKTSDSEFISGHINNSFGFLPTDVANPYDFIPISNQRRQHKGLSPINM